MVSFIRCLHDECAAALFGKDDLGNRREYRFLEHPIFLENEPYTTYVETVHNHMYTSDRFPPGLFDETRMLNEDSIFLRRGDGRPGEKEIEVGCSSNLDDHSSRPGVVECDKAII